MRAAAEEVNGEGWDLVTTAGAAQPEASTPPARGPRSEQRRRPVQMGLILQLSRFAWDEDPEGPAIGWPGWPAPPSRPACRESP